MDGNLVWVLLLTGLGSLLFGGVIFHKAEGENNTAAWVVGGVLGFTIGIGLFG